MDFFDSNVLVYAAMDQDPRKQKIALFLFAEAVERGTGAISLQVLREIANCMFKKSGSPFETIRDNVNAFKALPRVPESEALLDRGMEIKERYGIQFYDALIVASAEAAGCDTIYSEDMADGAKTTDGTNLYGSVRVVDPFKHSPGTHPAVPERPRSRTRRSKK